MDRVLWALVGVSLLHIVEEYALGFLNWFRTAIPRLAAAMTAGWAAAINTVFVGWLVLTAACASLPVAVRLSGAAIVLTNAVLHVVFTIRTRRYSPGLVTGLLLYLPIGCLAYRAAFEFHCVTTSDVLASIGLGLALHASTVASLKVCIFIQRRGD